MKRIALLLVLLVPVLAGCNGRSRGPIIIQQAPLGQPSVPPVATAPLGPTTGVLPGSSPEATPVVAGAEGPALDSALRTWLASQPGFNGTVLVTRGNQVLYSNAFGWADTAARLPMRPDAVWDWCSVSKQFAAAAILKLQMLGRVKLDGPLGGYLPVPADKASITLRQLLAHTSGLAQYDTYRTDPSREAALAVMLAQPFVSYPGQRWSYNNVNYTVIAAVIDRMSGMRYEDFVRRYLFHPAGMTGASFLGEPDVDATRVPKAKDGAGLQFPYGVTMPHWWRGAAGAMMSAHRLVQWDIALRGNAILDDASKQELYRVISSGYALGWFVDSQNGETIYSHDGAQIDISTMYYRAQQSGITILVATSRSNDQLWNLCIQLHAVARGLTAQPIAMNVGPSFQSIAQAKAIGPR